MGKILLFYKYVELPEPGAILKWQSRLCKKLGLTGRIIIATEGINGTVGGSDEATEAYKNAMEEHHYFGQIDYKEAPGDETYFPRMRIVIKEEIVRLGISPQELTVKDGGKHLTPTQVHELLNNPPQDLVILDTRNNYESRIGTFKNSITPDIKTFRELPGYIDTHTDQFKDKKVLMHCTGGVRCERATAYLNKKGIAKEIYQIEGGIQRYIEQYPDGHFRGSNYVFDGRIAERINNDILSQCDLCHIPCDTYTNCVNTECNKQFLACPNCALHFEECCSTKCHELVKNGEVKVRTQSARHTSIKKENCDLQGKRTTE